MKSEIQPKYNAEIIAGGAMVAAWWASLEEGDFADKCAKLMHHVVAYIRSPHEYVGDNSAADFLWQ